MRCAACGYEYEERGRWVDKVIYYKSGKNKGKVKEITKEYLEYNIGYEPFIKIRFEKEVDELIVQTDYTTNYVQLYACPECHTVRFE